MKAENVFKFVSVRGPLRTTRDEDVVIKGGDVGDEVVKLLHGLAREQRLSLDEARLVLGRRLIEDAAYYRRDATWLRLLAQTPAVEEAIRAARQSRAVGVFEQAIGEVLTVVFAQETSVDQFLDGAFAAMRATLWRAYYANVLNPYERPEDRDEAQSWLEVFELLAATRHGSRFAKLLGVYDRLRPAVPLAFYRPAVRASDAAPPPPKGDDELPGKLGILRDRIVRLEAVRAFVQERMAVRHREFRKLVLEESPAPPAALGPGARGASPQPRPAEGKSGSNSASSPAALVDKAPWRLTEADFRDDPPVLQTLRELGLHPAVLIGPELVTELERRIALLNRDLGDLTYSESIIKVGNVFARVARGRRVAR